VDQKDNPTPPAAGAEEGAPHKDQKGKQEGDLWGAKRASVSDLLAASRGDVAEGDSSDQKSRTSKSPSTVVPPSAREASSGTVSESAPRGDAQWQQQHRIWVVRNSERLFVIYARCTHLGCTPDWKASENKFKCPCHGSGYDSEGVNFEGPAPRPMDRAEVKLDAEGQIIVNTGKLYDWPKGGTNHFNDDGSFLRV
jgi:cytochrome b6-f complex iron-sulfur subunit